MLWIVARLFGCSVEAEITPGIETSELWTGAHVFNESGQVVTEAELVAGLDVVAWSPVVVPDDEHVHLVVPAACAPCTLQLRSDTTEWTFEPLTPARPGAWVLQ